MLLRHGVAQVRDERRVQRLHDLQPNRPPVDPLEQGRPAPKKTGAGAIENSSTQRSSTCLTISPASRAKHGTDTAFAEAEMPFKEERRAHMAQHNVSAGSVVHEAQNAARGAAHSPWVERLARLGYATKGVVFAIVGLLAARAAFGLGGEVTDREGALRAVVSRPFGQVLLGLLAIGLLGYALWRFVEALIDADGKGSDFKGIAQRLGAVVSGLAYAGLALTAMRMLTGGGGGEGTPDWTAWLMGQPFGPWLVALAGAVVIGVGIHQLHEGVTAGFRKHFKEGEMSQAERAWTTWLGRVGLTARGVVFGLIGAFLIQAGLRADPAQAQGIGGALQALAGQPLLPWAFGAVALGLIAYGVYMLSAARYRRLIEPGAAAR
jgi:hypothetical protein